MKNDMPDMKPASPFYRDYVKRVIDLLIAIPVLIVAAIPMAITAIAVKLDSPGPVLFKQDRLGKDGKVFKMLKFRSMCVGAEKTGSGVYSGKGDSRVTRVGKFIRATSLDELPQLFNVLSGDMSLLGPRPPLTYHPWPLEEYTEEQRHMFDVRPGFSGWAQVHGRKDVEWHHRIELNVWYVRHVRFSLDVKIFFMTIFKVLTNADNENKEETLKKEKDFDLALVDIMLPGKDGFALLPELQKAGIPVIFLTAKADVQSKVRGLKEGAEDYIVKPFEMLELLVRVEKVLERHQKGREILKVRDVEIDTEKRSVTKVGEEIYLKPMEYDCLLMFVRHKNKALTREQLLKALWGVDFEGETRTVDAHVGRIRKKLGFQDVIRTIPRIGYRLEVDE